MKYESSTTHQSNVMTKVKVFEKKIKLQGQRLEDPGHSRSWSIRNIHAKFESPTTYQSKVISNIKSFGKEGQTPRSKARGSRS